MAEFGELPTVPLQRLVLDTGAVVDADRGLAWWWDIDLFVESRESWVPAGPMPKYKSKRFKLPGSGGYNG